MKSKRALYGTLGIAMMGVMSSSFFGSTSGHQIHSISLSQEAPPAVGDGGANDANPSTTTHATTTAEKADHQKRVDEKKAKDAKVAADKKAADEKKAKEAKEKKAKDDDQDDAQASDDTDKVDKKADEEEKTLSVKSKGATYLFKGDHSKGKVQTQIYTDASGNVVERKMRAINATAARVAPDAARGSVCTDCEAESVEILIPVNASAQEILVAYQAKADSMEETVHAEDMRKKHEREATCEEPSDDQVKRARKVVGSDKEANGSEIAAALCQADLYGNSKTEKADKQDIFEKLKDMIVDLATSDASDKQQARKDLDKAKKFIAAIKKSDLRTKLEDTLKKVQASVAVNSQIKQVNGRADQALEVLNEAYELCPSLQNTRIGQNITLQNQQFGAAQQCGYASQMRMQAVQALNYDATQIRRYSPTALINAGLIARNPLDSGLSYDQAENLVFRPYVDFANNYQGATGQTMLSQTDRSMLQGLAGMEAFGPGSMQQNQYNTGLNSPLLQNNNNWDMGTFRTAQANGQQLSMTIPQIQGFNNGLNPGLNNNLNLNNNQMIRPVVNQNLQIPQTTLPNTQFSLLNNSNTGSYNGGLNYMSGTYVAPNFTSNTLSTPLQSTQLSQTTSGRTLSR